MTPENRNAAIAAAVLLALAVVVAVRHVRTGTSRLIDPHLHEATPSME